MRATRAGASFEEVLAAGKEAGIATSKLPLADYLGSKAALMAYEVLCRPFEGDNDSSTVVNPASTPYYTPTQTAASVQQRFLPG